MKGEEGRLIAEAIGQGLWASGGDGEGYSDLNATDALFRIANALDRIANALHKLGVAEASTPMGAIESFGDHIGKKLDALTDAIGSIGDSR